MAAAPCLRPLPLQALPLLLLLRKSLVCDGLRLEGRDRRLDHLGSPGSPQEVDVECIDDLDPAYSMFKALEPEDFQQQPNLARRPGSWSRRARRRHDVGQEDGDIVISVSDLLPFSGTGSATDQADNDTTAAGFFKTANATDDNGTVAAGIFNTTSSRLFNVSAPPRKPRWESTNLPGAPRSFAYQASTTRAPNPKKALRPLSWVQYEPARFHAWESWRAGPWESPPQDPPPQGRLAVILTGVLRRMLFPELLKNVVAAAKLTGYEVDVFASLVQEGNGATYSTVGHLSHFDGEPMFAGLKSAEDIARNISWAIGEAGGRVVSLELQTKEEDIAPLPEVNDNGLPFKKLDVNPTPWARRGDEETLYEGKRSRLSRYSPWKDPVGRNVLRRYRTIGKLMERVQDEAAASGRDYSWVLELREDLVWLAPLNLTRFNSSASPTLYSIDCLLYGGLNDKALLYNPQAGVLLGQRYSAFYNNSSPMLDFTHNAESYLGALVMVQNITVTLVPVEYLGAVSSMYRRIGNELEVCIRKTRQLFCVNPPVMPEYCDPEDATMRRRPGFCSDVD